MRKLITTNDLIHLAQGESFLVSGKRGKSGWRPPGLHLPGVLAGGSDFLASFNGFGLRRRLDSSILALDLNCFFHCIGCSKDVGS